MQAGAKDLDIDLDDSGGAAALRSLIDDEVQRWVDDHRRGRQPVELADPARVAERAFRDLAGYGPLEPLLADPDVWDVTVDNFHAMPCGQPR